MRGIGTVPNVLVNGPRTNLQYQYVRNMTHPSSQCAFLVRPPLKIFLSVLERPGIILPYLASLHVARDLHNRPAERCSEADEEAARTMGCDT